MTKELSKLDGDILGYNPLAALAKLSELYAEKAVFSSSLGLEDQVITHMIFENDLPIDVFTLDTGRLFPETLTTLEDTVRRYGKPIKIYRPNPTSVEELVNKKGAFSFFDSIANRQECCYIRKVEPLKRALSGKKVWITGIRAEQSGQRNKVSQLEWDEGNQIIKFHPLLKWSLSEIKKYITDHTIPYNVLHDRGFPSIGCEPCTRAIKPGEDVRAGRWWWENEDKKECGLHDSKKDN